MGGHSAPGYARHPSYRVDVTLVRGRVIVTRDGRVLADSRQALEMVESGHAPVYYLPRDDVRMDRLSRSELRTYCPFKGEASYFHVDGTVRDAAWSYETPYDEIDPIRAYLAFYPEGVDSIDLVLDE